MAPGRNSLVDPDRRLEPTSGKHSALAILSSNYRSRPWWWVQCICKGPRDSKVIAGKDGETNQAEGSWGRNNLRCLAPE